MKYIKNFQLFEDTQNIINLCYHNAKINDIITEDIIYQYVQLLHREYDDFVEGDLGDRIEKYSKYKLKEILINKININEFDTNDYLIDEIIIKINNNNNYPPIILESEYFNEYSIIDGAHRTNALYKLGYKFIKAWVGIE